MSWTITIPLRTPSQNELHRKYRTPRAYAKLRFTLEQWVMVLMRNESVPFAFGRRKLTITRFAVSRRHFLDRGNLIGGCKPLLDAAIHQRLIVDDKEEYLDDEYRQEVGDEKVVVLIEDI